MKLHISPLCNNIVQQQKCPRIFALLEQDHEEQLHMKKKRTRYALANIHEAQRKITTASFDGSSSEQRKQNNIKRFAKLIFSNCIQFLQHWPKIT